MNDQIPKPDAPVQNVANDSKGNNSQKNKGQGRSALQKTRQEANRLEKEVAALKAEKHEWENGAAKHKLASNIRPAAPKARVKPRHISAAFSFLIFALCPPLIAGWYLSERAADRYISRAAFSVRTEEIGSAFELLGGVAELSGSSSTDTEILYQFITSQELVLNIEERLDLRTLWSKGDYEKDPIFTYKAPGTIEDLTEYWNRMVDVYSDTGTGLIELEVQGFTPQDALAINAAIYDESLAMINRLSAIAREDGTRYAREDLDAALERLRTARLEIMQFRNRTQIVDPAASLQSQMGILSSLQSALANELIELDVLLLTTGANDPRIIQAQKRIDVIERRIIVERGKFGVGDETGAGSDGEAFAELIGEYESLQVNLEFSEATFQAARATLDTAVAEARRQSRYLAAHIRPTIPEKAGAPNRQQTILLVALFSFLVWGVGILSAYSVRDRK